MRIKLKRIASCLVVVCLTVTMLTGLTIITENKGSRQKFMQFFSQEADFDVLFMGSSKVINGILPMELWNDYGIISYNMGGHANSIPTSYWVLRNALNYTTPKCVVFDCSGAGSNNMISSKFDYAHLSFDAFPLSPTKVQAVLDLVTPDAWENVRAKRMELLWNFSIYHSNWNAVSLVDFNPLFTYQKGAEPRPNVSLPAKSATVSPNLRRTPNTKGMEYLIKAIELCKERNIHVILIHLPYPSDEGTLITANTVSDIATDYDVEYLNFFNLDIVNYQTDMYDPNSHLNPSGAYKITDFLGTVLSQKYGIPDQRNHPDYQSWHNDAQMYRQEKITQFEKTTSAWNYWMLLSDDDFSFVAELSKSDLLQDSTLTALLCNAGIQTDEVTEQCIIAADRSSGTVSCIDRGTLLEGPIETSIGTLSLEEDSLRWNGQECWQYPAAMNFLLLDTDGNLLGTSCFSSDNIQSEHAD